MKKFFLIFATTFLLISFVNAQKGQVTRSYNTTVYTSFIDKAKANCQLFMKTHSITLISQDETVKDYSLLFFIDEKGFSELDSFIHKLGYVKKKTVSTQNDLDKKEDIELEIGYLIKQKSTYEKELSSMTEKEDRYFDYWERFVKLRKNYLN